MESFIETKKDEWEALSDRYQDAFVNQGNDPEVIFEFIKSSYHAMRAPWLIEQVQSWYSRHEFGLLEKLCKSGRGRGKDRNKYMTACVSLATFDRVNSLVKNGMTKNAAFKELSKQKIMGAVYDEGTIRNQYYNRKKRRPEMFIEESDDHWTIIIVPTRLHLEDKKGRVARIYGEGKLKIPK
jgi:hypothetical protein